MWKLLIGTLAFGYACASGVYAGDTETEFKAKALAHYIMGVTYDLNGQTDEAISEYEQSAQMDNTQPLPHLRLATYHARTGGLAKSIQQLNMVLALEPQNAQARYLLALIYSAQKKYDQAASEYESILKNVSQDNPGNLEIYTYLAQLYYSQGKYKQAIEQFQRILSIDPDNISANYLLGTACLETQQRPKAMQLFKEVLRLQPDNDEALNSLAYMYAEDEVNLDEGLRMARKAVDLDPSNGAYFDTLGWLLFKKGMNSEALLSFQKAEMYVHDSVVYEHMGDVYYAIKEFVLARKYWRKSLDLQPHQPQVKAKLEELEKLQAFRKPD